MDNERRTQPLEIKVEDDVLTISIGISTLCYAVQQELHDVSIHDEDAFVKDFLVELQQEDEEGSTNLHKLFDRTAIETIENGSMAAKEIEESEGDLDDQPGFGPGY